jgi:hypothetical protein
MYIPENKRFPHMYLNPFIYMWGRYPTSVFPEQRTYRCQIATALAAAKPRVITSMFRPQQSHGVIAAGRGGTLKLIASGYFLLIDDSSHRR